MIDLLVGCGDGCRYRLVFHPSLPQMAFIGFVRPAGLGAIPPLGEPTTLMTLTILIIEITPMTVINFTKPSYPYQ